MSVKYMGMVFDADLPRNQKYILLGYADHADHEGRNIYPSVEHMAWKTGYSERAVQTITRELEEAEILVPDGTGPNGTNRYRMNADALPQRPSFREMKQAQEGANSAPPQKLQGGANSAPGGCKKAQDGGANSAPDPSLDPSSDPSVIHARANGDGPNTTPVPPGAPGHLRDDYDEEHHLMVTALAEVCRENLHYGPNEEKFNSAAQALLASGATPDEIRRLFGSGESYWYLASYGQKGQQPWLKNVVNGFDEARSWNGQAPVDDNALQAAWERLLQYGDSEIAFADLTEEEQGYARQLGGDNLRRRTEYSERQLFQRFKNLAG